jgi:hypothetical protein
MLRNNYENIDFFLIFKCSTINYNLTLNKILELSKGVILLSLREFRQPGGLKERKCGEIRGCAPYGPLLSGDVISRVLRKPELP